MKLTWFVKVYIIFDNDAMKTSFFFIIYKKIANSAQQSLDLSVDGMQLTKVESERVLGVHIDSHLTWNEHIDTHCAENYFKELQS